jgi:hypothetical protein
VLSIVDWRLQHLNPVRDPVQRCMHYRTFKKGVTGWGKWTADDHIALLQQMPYVVGTDATVIRTTSQKPREAFIAACTEIRVILQILKRREVTEDHLLILHTSAKHVGQHLKDAVLGLPRSAQENISVDRPCTSSLPVSCPYLVLYLV